MLGCRRVSVRCRVAGYRHQVLLRTGADWSLLLNCLFHRSSLEVTSARDSCATVAFHKQYGIRDSLAGTKTSSCWSPLNNQEMLKDTRTAFYHRLDFSGRVKTKPNRATSAVDQSTTTEPSASTCICLFELSQSCLEARVRHSPTRAS